MQSTWIKRAGHDTCILFFNGWGMDANCLSALDSEPFDVCLFGEYAHLNFEQEPFASYQTRIVIAWSMGVAVANKLMTMGLLHANQFIAINGTAFPYHEREGIPEAVARGTLEGWREQARQKFNLRMVGGRKELEQLQSLMSCRDVSEQQQELRFLLQLGNEKLSVDSHWNKAFCSAGDLIIPYDNQLNFWEGRCEVIQTNWPHIPFGKVNCWKQLIEENHAN